MKTKSLFVALIMMIYISEKTSAQIIFQKTIGGITNDYVDNTSCVNQTIDSGYIIAGYTFSYGAGSADVYLIKTDVNGDTSWTKTFGGTGYDYATSIQQTSDSGFIIVGGTQSFGVGGFDVYLIKTDVNGDTLWTRTIGGSSNELGNGIDQTTDGGYIITGQTISFGVGDFNIYLIKTDINGFILWTRTFGGLGDDNGFSVQQTLDSGFIMAGFSNYFGAGSQDIYLIKTDVNGDTLWTKTFGGINEDDGFYILQTNDSGYIVSGCTFSFDVGMEDIYLIKTDINGDTLWTKTYGGADWEQGNEIQQTTDGGYIITGITGSFGAGSSDIYLIKIDASGDTLWTKTFGGTGYDYGYSVQQTNDGGFIIAGYTNSFGAGGSDIYLIKIDSIGNSGCNQGITATIIGTPATQIRNTLTQIASGGLIFSSATVSSSGGIVTSPCIPVAINELAINNLLIVSPNPFSNVLSITGTNGKGESVIFDLTGKKILKTKTFDNETSINTELLMPGFYLFQYHDESNTINFKVIKN